MNQAAQDFINRKNEEYEALTAQEKRDFLDSAGLMQIVYEDKESVKGLSSEEKAEMFPFKGYDDSGFAKRYRKEYPSFTDEEFAAMKEAQERVDAAKADDKKDKGGSSGLATFLNVLGAVLFIGAFFAGIILASKEVTTGTYHTHTVKQFDFATAVIYWGVGLFSGSVMLGFASIVENLHQQTALMKAMLRKGK